MVRQRGAIVVTGIGGEGIPDPAALRIGPGNLLSHVLSQVGPLVTTAVVTAAAGGPPPRITARVPAEVVKAPLPAGSRPPARAVAEAAALLPDAVQEVAVLTGDLPHLTQRWLAGLFGAYAPGRGGVCAREGARLNPCVGVYGRDALRAGVVPPEPEARLLAGEGGLAGFPAEPEAEGLPSPAAAVRDAATYRRALAVLGFCDPRAPAVTLELYGSLRLRTGCAALPLHAATVGAAVEALRRVYPELARTLGAPAGWGEHFRVAVNGGSVTTDAGRPLREGDALVLFSAEVGG